jgi:hypothetical protein
MRSGSSFLDQLTVTVRSGFTWALTFLGAAGLASTLNRLVALPDSLGAPRRLRTSLPTAVTVAS